MCDHALGKDCFQSCYDFHYTFSNKGRVVPKHSHTHPMEGHWKRQGGRHVPKVQNCTGNYELNEKFAVFCLIFNRLLKPVFECAFAPPMILFLSYLVKNSMDRVSMTCKLAMKWYLMHTCASWLNVANEGDIELNTRREIPYLPTSSPGSSRFPIWRRQERRPWHTAEITWLICPRRVEIYSKWRPR